MKKTVFWSWQSDLQPDVTRNFIKRALSDALKKVEAELELEPADRLELDHDTKGEAGLVEIVATIFKKIDECEVFVADVTPVTNATFGQVTKSIPNPNVMIELGYALRELGHQRIITVCNLAFGGKPEELPFDLRHRRGAFTYTLGSANDPSIEKKRKLLVNQLADALKNNLAAPREDRMIRNPLPDLSLVTSDTMSSVALIAQNATLEWIPPLAEIMATTPVKSKADQTKPGPYHQLSKMDFNRQFSMGNRTRIKPFEEWTQEELDGYNKQVQEYYKQYTTYLENALEHKLFLQRAIVVELVLENSGTRPATDARVNINFPPDTLIYEREELPEPPTPPTPPPFAPHGNIDTVIPQSSSLRYDFKSILDKRPRIADDHRSVVIKISKIQHNRPNKIESFILLFTEERAIKSFEADYNITADELPSLKKGKLNFEVKRSD